MQAQRMTRARLPPDWGPKSWSIRGKDLRRRKTLPPGRQATIGFSALMRTRSWMQKRRPQYGRGRTPRPGLRAIGSRGRHATWVDGSDIQVGIPTGSSVSFIESMVNGWEAMLMSRSKWKEEWKPFPERFCTTPAIHERNIGSVSNFMPIWQQL